ncbi:hypothetical protein TNIN_493721 [Trichonephila inaurata madagascariensis]|uniref:Uncharacterized protein n=1 Tax=Trichonephila inaurata madagascariensis TaxID=2747483 RepID=A0A8X7C421_9ARAC|nr:hypothetical protein TNIN_493721 [Trichonephila inaurata madagascariensis]
MSVVPSLNIPDLRELMEEVITNRNIPAASHKVFDPLGIIGPVLLLIILWLQSLWKSQIGWDREVDIKTRFSEMTKGAEILKACSCTKVVFTVIVDFSIFRYIFFSVTQANLPILFLFSYELYVYSASNISTGTE